MKYVYPHIFSGLQRRGIHDLCHQGAYKLERTRRLDMICQYEEVTYKWWWVQLATWWEEQIPGGWMSEAKLSKSDMIIPDGDSQVQLEERESRRGICERREIQVLGVLAWTCAHPLPPRKMGENWIGFPLGLNTRDAQQLGRHFYYITAVPKICGLLSWHW